jgi:hypothetical protein
MKKIYLLALLINCYGFSIAQPAKYLESIRKTYQGYLSKPLCVILDTEDEKFVAKLERKGKKQELKNYRELIDTYNETIKVAAEQYLDVFRELKFITDDEVKKMGKDEWKENYFLRRSFPIVLRTKMAAPMGMEWADRDMEHVDLDPAGKTNNSMIEFIEYDRNSRLFQAIISQPLCRLFCTKGEIYFAVRQLRRTIDDALNKTTNAFIKEREAEIREEMKTRTLIINKRDLSPGLTEATIKKVYPYRFKIVGDNEFDEQLMAKNEDVLVLIAIPFPMGGLAGDRSHTFYNTGNEYIYRPHYKKCADEIKSEDFSYYLMEE